MGAEHGAIGDGFGPSDSEVSHMIRHYHSGNKRLYPIVVIAGTVVGGGGIARFNHLDHPPEGTIHNGCDAWMLKTL